MDGGRRDAASGRDVIAITSVGGRTVEGSLITPGSTHLPRRTDATQSRPYPYPYPYPYSAYFTHGFRAKNHLSAIFSAPRAFGWTLSRMVSFCGSKPVN
jgi:hypothetical protein